MIDVNENRMTLKEIASRKEVIENELENLFQKNMKITDWDVPEANDQVAAQQIMDILENKLNQIKTDVVNGKYKNY